jgi:uncharacterized protein DUF1549/uncharacterized protein DUF1553
MKQFFSRRLAILLSFSFLVSAAMPSRFLLRSQPAPAQDDWSKPGAKPQAKKAAAGAAKSDVKPRPVAAHIQARAAIRELTILPASIALDGPRASQRLVVEAVFSDGHDEDVTGEAKLSSSNPRVAAIDQGFVKPGADGDASVRASYQGRQAAAAVEVKNFTAPFVWSFRNHVLPVMTKMGCNSGPCHGAAAGKNGFKLTLRGYDPEVDYYTLTRQALARRTERLEPAKSLILLKPTLTISHGGGRRFPVGSPEYQVISGWIAAAMPPPRDDDPRIVDLEVLPREASLAPGADQQLLVRAKFSDGRIEDVSRWAKYSSGDMGVATVDDSGHVKMTGYGEAPVTVWYLSQVTFARLSVPFPAVIDPSVFAKAKRDNFIDDLVLKKLQTLHIPPSRQTTDAEFIRRAYLDAAGILPTSAETEKFLADRSPDKRSRLIDALTKRPEFVDYWAYKWSDLLLVSSNKLSTEGMWSYYNWIRQSVAKDKPWDQFVREIVIATGNARENGAANYWVIHRDPTDIAENITQAFLGTTITCAHCHNHPLDKWTRKDYFAMANLFSRVRLKTAQPAGSKPGAGTILEDVTVYSSPTGEFDYPPLARPLPPKPLDAKALPLDSPANRRQYLAEWLTSPDNRYFARALVNRVWRNFMGRGLVEPADDMRASNPPSNEDLLNALTKDFVGHDFDVNGLIRTVMNSAAYQTASEPTPQNIQDEKYYSHYVIRRLPAEVLLDAYSEVAGVPEKFDGYPAGMRALQLPDTAVESYFLTAFGRPPREQTRESDRTSEPSITQALHVINGNTLNQKLRAPGSTVDMLLKLGLSNQRMVDYMFLAAFSRYPTDAERQEIVQDLEAAGGKRVPGSAVDSRRAALIDVSWAVLTSKEFMFNH